MFSSARLVLLILYKKVRCNSRTFLLCFCRRNNADSCMNLIFMQELFMRIF